MLIKRTAIWLFAASALALLAARALAQPAHSNIHYQVPHPTYEHGSAPFSDDNPGPSHVINPFHPLGFEPAFDWFAPAETSGYGRGPRPHVGYFFSYERLFWSLSKPETAVIGSETATGAGVSFPNGSVINLGGVPIGLQGIPTIYTNTVDTGYFTANGAWGNRWEVGYWDVDDYGWMASILDHVSQSQYKEHNSAILQFDDPGNQLIGTNFDSFVIVLGPGVFPTIEVVTDGKMPIRFDRLQVQNIARLNGVELTRMYRARELHSGAFFELLYGVRWLQLQDTFDVKGFNSFQGDVPPISPNGDSAIVFYFNPLADSRWMTRTQNNMVGPQIGFRLWRQRERWVTSLETRFLAAANFQSVNQMTNLGNNTLSNTAFVLPSGIDFPLIFQGLGGSSSSFATQFSPVGELRLNVDWQVTRNIALTVGYTGLVVGNVTRASKRVDYSGPNLISILPGNNRDIFYANGVNFGFEVNK
jgi:hypothetical protein